MTSPDWATPTTQPRRKGPRGSEEYQPPELERYVSEMIELHDLDQDAHQFIQQLILQALAVAGITRNPNGSWAYIPPGVPDATTTTKGSSRLLAGSADFPLVPWTAVSGKPFIPVQYNDLQNLPVIPKTYGDITGTLPASALPPLGIVDYLGSVATQAAMLALVGQRGDWCIRSDRGSVFIIIGDTPTALASWKELSYPTAPVTSVNNRTGAVTGLAEAASLTKGGVGLGNVDNTSDLNKPISTATQTALNNKLDSNTSMYGLVQDDDIDVTPTTTAVTGTTSTDITNGTANVYAPGTYAKYRVIAVFDVSATAANTAGNAFQGRLLVDGVVQAGAATFMSTITNTRATVMQMWTVTGLATGNRVFKINGVNSATSSYSVNGANSGLNIRRVR